MIKAKVPEGMQCTCRSRQLEYVTTDAWGYLASIRDVAYPLNARPPAFQLQLQPALYGLALAYSRSPWGLAHREEPAQPEEPSTGLTQRQILPHPASIRIQLRITPARQPF